jgi:hypothetical protein
MPHLLAKGVGTPLGIGRDEAADLDITAKTDRPNDGFAQRFPAFRMIAFSDCPIDCASSS